MAATGSGVMASSASWRKKAKKHRNNQSEIISVGEKRHQRHRAKI